MDYSLDDIKVENMMSSQNFSLKPRLNSFNSHLPLDHLLNNQNEQDELLSILQQQTQQNTYKTPQNEPEKAEIQNEELNNQLVLKKQKSRGRSKFTDDDDFKIFMLVQQHGKDWKFFTSYFPGKSPTQIQNRYFKSIKKSYDKFQNRYKIYQQTQQQDTQKQNLSDNNLFDIKCFHDDNNINLNNICQIDQEQDHLNMMDDEYYKFQNLPLRPDENLTLHGDHNPIVQKYDQNSNFLLDNKPLLSLRNFNPIEANEKIKKIQFLKTQVFTLEQMMIRCKEEIMREIKQETSKFKNSSSSQQQSF